MAIALVSAIITPSIAIHAATITWSDAIQRTEKENPDIAAATEKLRAASARKLAAYSGFLPTIKAAVGVENTEKSGTGGVALATGSGWTAGIEGRLYLFSGFADQSKVAQAEADHREALAAVISTKAKVSADLKIAFETAAFASESKKLSAQILKRREENLKLVQLRFESGRENKGSVLLSEAYLEDARYEYLQAQNATRTASQALAKVLALDGDGTAALEVSGEIPISNPSLTAPSFETLALATPDYVQVVERTKSTVESVRSARSSFLPTLQLDASIDKRGDEFFPNEVTTRAIGLTLKIPLFDGGKDYGAYNAAMATATAAEWTRANTLRETKTKLEQAWADYLESIAKLKADESFRKAAVTRSEIARAKYNNGLLSFEDWDIIENDLITREKAVLETRRRRTTAEAAWEQAQGKGIWP